jgi:pyridoxamine 5'-phosphate oxidase
VIFAVQYLAMKHLRQDYNKHELLEKDLLASPFQQFNQWFSDALQGGVLEPNAMTLATCVDNKPSARIVLLKEVDATGFIFYTNYTSRKGNELANNEYAAILFFWENLERQIRVEGIVEKVTAEVSDAYFNERPKGSRIGAIVSPQSKIINSREQLEQDYAQTEKQLINTDEIKRPEHWGGYRLVPNYFEFWQGRSSRLHDRLVYEKGDASWNVYRLAP